MKLSTVARERIRLVIISVGLIPLAIVARACYSTILSEFVQRTGARAWKNYDRVVRDGGARD